MKLHLTIQNYLTSTPWGIIRLGVPRAVHLKNEKIEYGSLCDDECGCDAACDYEHTHLLEGE